MGGTNEIGRREKGGATNFGQLPKGGGATNFGLPPKGGGGQKISDLINFFNVPKTSFFHVLGYFGHFSFFIFWSWGGGGAIFGRFAKGREKFWTRREGGAKNLGLPIVLES